MNLWLILAPCLACLVILAGMAVAAMLGIDGFRGDKDRHVPVAAPVTTVDRPTPVAVASGSIRVTAERVTQVEAA